MAQIEEGNRVLILTAEGRRYLLPVKGNGAFHTHRGYIEFSEIIGKEWGAKVKTFYLLPPTFEEVMKKGIRRQTQIVYPRDGGYLLLRMNIHPGSRVLEIGTGSGAMTALFANFVRPNGKVFTYEVREEFFHLSRKNMEALGLDEFVVFHLKDAREGVEETEVNVCFVDVKTPWEFLEIAWKSLVGGGMLGTLLPTTNQVQQLLKSVESFPFVDVQVVELLERRYKVNAERLRPEDRMVAHTGYLITARKVLEK